MDIYITRIITASVILVSVFGLLYWWLSRKKSPWLRGMLSGAPVSPYRILLMHMRKTDVSQVLELNLKAAQSRMKMKLDDVEQMVRSLGSERAGVLMDAAGIAKRENIEADLGELKSHQVNGGDVRRLIECKIMADRTGVDAGLSEIAGHDIAHGNVRNIIEAVSMASKAGISLDFKRASAVDMAGRDILEAVRTMIQPKLIRTPRITAMSKDGFQVSAAASISVRTDPDDLLGGAGEETILARAAESLAAAISRSDSHQRIVERPGDIAEEVWEEDLDEDTAFVVLSVELTDIEVGENVGNARRMQEAQYALDFAKTQSDIKDYEMKSKMQELRAKLLEEEAKIPTAMAKAFSKGNLSLMDYYRLKRINRDQGRDEDGKDIEEMNEKNSAPPAKTEETLK